MEFEGLDVVAYVYDVNTNTNYNSGAERSVGISAMAPRQIFRWGLATTWLLSIGAQTGAQNVPFDLQLAAL